MHHVEPARGARARVKFRLIASAIESTQQVATTGGVGCRAYTAARIETTRN